MSRQANDRECLLGELIRGILHELANPLNTILMNAELAALTATRDASGDELAEVLTTVRNEARRGGELVRNLARFAGGEEFLPAAAGEPGRAISLGQRLVGSAARTRGATLRLAIPDNLPRLPLDEMAMALAIAQAIVVQLDRGARVLTIRARMLDDALEIRIEADEIPSDAPAPALPHPAARILADHGGAIEFDGGTCVLRLALPSGAGDRT